jgi:hypothetical protein
MDPVIISIQSEPWMDSFILAEGTNGVKRRFMEWFKMELVGDTPPTKFENRILDHIKTLCDKFDTLTGPSVVTESIPIASVVTESIPIARVPRTYLYSADGVPTDPEELARGEAAIAAIIHAANPMIVTATAETCRIPSKPK